ncbi:phosphatidate cytidylyltransferase [Moniliophthora roreri]|uniref:Phosphatidate cytidylyltransferase n=1 Tax=Moniliophthora roreri TaxID=221103 RepID=A0A0W0FGX2_MONRR|nr:phosphatidate cytidylyltransferase [Moniliophthora roreri]
MSTPQSRFASKTLFSALAVESDNEESEEEQIVESIEQTPISSEPGPAASPPRLTKTAQKKAAKAAREAKQKSRVEAQNKLPQANGNAPPTETETKSSPASSPGLIEPLPEPETAPAPAPSAAGVPVHDTTKSEPAKVAEQKVVVEPKPVTETVESPQIEEATEVIKQAIEVSEVQSEDIPVSVEQKAPLSAKDENALPPNNEKKRQAILTRTLWTFIMIGGFIGLLLMGHAYMILLVMLCQTVVYREVTALFSLKSPPPPESGEKKSTAKDPWSKTLNWYFFAVTNYFLYGESIIYYFKHVVFSDAQLLPFATNHRIISFTLYTIGFVGFVMSLKKGYLKQQFGLFCWVHMSLLLIVVSSHFIINNILEGLIWFWVPASLVICNDVFAYVCGITLGRTPLIKLSPKKTVEGFVGAFWCTMLFSLAWGAYFMRFKYMICPVHDLGVNAWSNVDCTPNPVFVWKEWQIWEPLAALLSTTLGRAVTTIPYVPYFAHLLILSCFASLVAPFGGFFASGFKRAFNIKDFGHSIPGHGGMTDRMDCQFLMGVFTYVYYSSLIRQHHVTVGSVLQTIVSGLTVEEQLELIADLKRYLEGMSVQVPC